MSKSLEEKIRDLLDEAARKAAPQATAETDYLCPPFNIAGSFDSPAGTREVTRWFFCNPFGPSDVVLSFERLIDQPQWVILLSCIHPMCPSGTVYGLAPDALLKDGSGLRRMLRRLFSPGEKSLIGSPPDYVSVDSLPAWGIGAAELRELFHLAVIGNRRNLVDAVDEQRRSVDQRLKSLFSESLRNSAEREPDARRAVERLTLDLEASAAERMIQFEEATDEDLFTQWWNTATDSEYKTWICGQMSIAWSGSQQFLRNTQTPSP